MSKVMLELIQTIDSCEGVGLFLPNGVAVLDSGNFVVADGGNDRVCLFQQDGKAIKSVGSKGFGRYKFKEPVGVFISPDQKIYVADWHNHRIVIYENDLNYLGEFGHYGKVDGLRSVIQNFVELIKFLKALSYTGCYSPFHFSAQKSEKSPKLAKYSISLLVKGLIYWYHRNGGMVFSVKQIFNEFDALAKPNGVAFLDDKILVTQKDARCVSVYNKEEILQFVRRANHIFGPSEDEKFGRLGRVACSPQGFTYVCDERNSVVWVLDGDFKLANKIVGADSGTGMFLPFSCCFLDDNYLAVCGGLNFQIFHLPDNQLLFCSEKIGELHCIAYDSRLNRLYLVDRSNCRIMMFKISLN